MIRAGAALVGVVTALSGCAYYNTIHNAQRTYDEAERHRRAGRDSVAEERYREVIRAFGPSIDYTAPASAGAG